jgi:nitrogen fixation/metabolism regulation signal transduction histidine kinase
MSKASRLAWLVALVALMGTALVLTFVLAVATGHQHFYERHFGLLFGMNVGVAALLVLTIVVTVARLGMRLARGRFGGRLLLKLAAIFALLAMVPGVLIYTVSYQFVSRSIESWFDVKVEGALQAGLDMARPLIKTRQDELLEKARVAASGWAEAGPGATALTLDRLRDQAGVSQMALLSAEGAIVLSVSLRPDEPDPPRLPSAWLAQAKLKRAVARLEGLDDDAQAHGTASPAQVQALAWVPAMGFELVQKDRYIWLSQSLPSDLVANAKAVENVYTDYHDLSAGRQGLRKMYIGTLTLALILAVFGALLLSVTLAKQLAAPLLLLAEGMQQVAKGDLSTKAVYASNDELGWLTRAFADMTEQLAEARLLVNRSVTQVEASRANLQTILDNLSAGVIVFNREGQIETANPAATRIVRVALTAYRGHTLGEVPGLQGLAAGVSGRFEAHVRSESPGDPEPWQDSFELEVDSGKASPVAVERLTLTLLVRGAVMPGGAHLLVFDDITELASAQRTQAWGEVARRLAHEIKNPLTPIQLSAERLEHKLAAKLEGGDQAMLKRAVAMIVTQVQSMKTLVNEFRDYARLPSGQMRPLDLNTLVSDVLVLYAHEQEKGRLVASLHSGLPLIEGDLTQLRQVLHNLVQNALDAVSALPEGRVEVRTELRHSPEGRPLSARLLVRDNGPGFAEAVLKRAFEPYVTTKAKGTGLGLAVVKKIADEHGARVRVANLGAATGDTGESADAKGAQVSLSFSRFALAPSALTHPAAPAPG